VNSRDVLRRLRAFQAGRPLPRGETLHFDLADDEDALVLAFARMGGESRPWGIAYGPPGQALRILTVPEARNRDLVAEMAARFAPTLLKHLRVSGFVERPPASSDGLRPLRQIWLPNPSHLDMIHHIAYAYTFTKSGGEMQALLRALGRACTWLFNEAQRPGEQHVRVATEALRESFTFPAQNVRQAHLGYLLAWLETDGDRDARIAAASVVEKTAISTSLDPTVEREEIEPLLDEWHDAGEQDTKVRERAAREIDGILQRELRHRFDLTCRAIALLRSDPRRINAGVATLIDRALKEQWYQFQRRELNIFDRPDEFVFIPSPETDRNPPAAAARYQVHLASEELEEAALVQDDRELFADAVASGDAFFGDVVSVVDEGKGRSRKPVWEILSPYQGPLRLREGSWVCLIGLPNRYGEIRSIDDQDDGTRLFEVEIRGLKTRPRGPAGRAVPLATEQSLVGHTVEFIRKPETGLADRKSSRIWNREVPGAWLTHRKPEGRRARISDEAAEELDLVTAE